MDGVLSWGRQVRCSCKSRSCPPTARRLQKVIQPPSYTATAGSSSSRGSNSRVALQELRAAVVCRASEADAAWATAQLKGVVADLRDDPTLSPLLDDPGIAAAVREVATNPSALARYASNPKVMAVLSRLADKGLSRRQAATFQAAGTSAGQLLTNMAAQPELAALLGQPAVRAALARIRAAADPEAETVAACEADPQVARALDLLESSLASQAGLTIDVVPDSSSSSRASGSGS